MRTLWERRIAHLDRRVGPLELRGICGRLRKADVRARRGLPSRNVSIGATFDLFELKLAARRGEAPDRELFTKLQWRLLRERLLERKRAQVQAARSRRRVSVDRTKINLWRRRRDWLREVEGDSPA